MARRENEALVRAFFGALCEGDIDAMMQLATDDFTWTLIGSTPISGTYRGKDAVLRDFFGGIGDALDFEAGIGLDIEEVIATEDRVIVRARGAMHAKYGPYNNEYCHVMTVRDGKIAATVEYVDTVLIERAFYGRSLEGVTR